MKWSISAPFFHESGERWLDDFVPPSKYTFSKVPSIPISVRDAWHTRLSRRTPLSSWRGYWNQAGRAWDGDADGHIAVFPQLALTLAAKKRFSGKDRPLVAWCFNVGAAPILPLRFLSSRALNAVDHFVVHSRGEIDVIASWFAIEHSRISYTPLQRARIPVYAHEEEESPFVLAMGSAHRDYATLFEAIAPLRMKTIVVAAPRALKGVNLPPNVEWRQNLSAIACHRLSQQARLNVIPLLPNPTAVGQVTIVEAMRMGRALIATDAVGSRDYISNGENGLLVPPADVEALRSAIDYLWNDASARERISMNAGAHAEENFSDVRAGIFLKKVLDAL